MPAPLYALAWLSPPWEACPGRLTFSGLMSLSITFLWEKTWGTSKHYRITSKEGGLGSKHACVCASTHALISLLAHPKLRLPLP